MMLEMETWLWDSRVGNNRNSNAYGQICIEKSMMKCLSYDVI